MAFLFAPTPIQIGLAKANIPTPAATIATGLFGETFLKESFVIKEEKRRQKQQRKKQQQRQPQTPGAGQPPSLLTPLAQPQGKTLLGG